MAEERRRVERARRKEERFLSGPQPRGSEFVRALGIFWEFMRGFRALHFVGPCVTVFGSARFNEENGSYAQARELGAAIAEAGFTVMTGGGPGIMEAANRGAMEAGGQSVGAGIQLPQEQRNAYMHRFVEFDHFYVRKVMLLKYSYAFVACPGGLGTLDEVFETAVLIQTGKIHDFPVVLMGTDFWGPLLEALGKALLGYGTIEASDIERLVLTDSPQEAVDHIRQAVMDRFGLKYGPRPHRRRWLLER